LLRDGKAAVYRAVPFTIILKKALPDAVVKSITIKIKQSSKTTGLALVEPCGRVLFAAELPHRGQAIKAALDARRSLRRGRRGRKTRYRAARFNNRAHTENRLPPSLQHCVDTTMAGYSAREYLLEKWDRKCAYCDATNLPLQVEHIYPKANGGGNAVSSLTQPCDPCNKKKDTQSIKVFLKNKPLIAKKILADAKRLLGDAAAVNSTRWALANLLKASGLPVELSNGERTKFNRFRQYISKTQALDVACMGNVGAVENWNIPTLEINCTGRGSYQRTRLDKYGFPRGYLMRQKAVKGFQTGDMVKAVVTKGKKIGDCIGWVAIRAMASFNITGSSGTV
jgi:5-methylcytosine-specific restriction endonuclease McrA